MTDTHTHLYYTAYGEGYEEAIERAVASGVSRMILPGIDLPSIEAMNECHRKYPDATLLALGLHPTDVKENWGEIINEMEAHLNSGKYVAVGEVGIDLHWDPSTLPLQKEAFARQLKIADRLGLPVIIHSRDALEETLEVILRVNPAVPLIFHSFTGSFVDVKRIREVCDAYFGINGVVTYKSAGNLREALPEIGLSRILLETDSPYLSPVPHRGEKNESAYLINIRDKVAEVLGVRHSVVEVETDNNARKLFKL